MRLNSKMSKEEIRTALNHEAVQTWGEERLAALNEELDDVAGAIWTVLQVPVLPLEEEPDFALRAYTRGKEE